VRTAVDDSVHVEVEVIEFWQECCVGDDLVDFWIAFADPAVELSSSWMHACMIYWLGGPRGLSGAHGKHKRMTNEQFMSFHWHLETHVTLSVGSILDTSTSIQMNE
jgi:hypothetical protein